MLDGKMGAWIRGREMRKGHGPIAVLGDFEGFVDLISRYPKTNLVGILKIQ
jgi:hypothetical protein